MQKYTKSVRLLIVSSFFFLFTTFKRPLRTVRRWVAARRYNRWANRRRVAVRLARATSGLRLSASGWPGGLMHTTCANPADRRSSASATWPATSHTGTHCWRQAWSTRCGNLPMSVWRSAQPSPVTTTVAPRSISSKWANRNSRSAPICALAPKHCMKA